jgi:hypothetical protein
MIWFVLSAWNVSAKNDIPDVSIVTGKLIAASVWNGINTLTEALENKELSYEKVNSIKDATGRLIIVVGPAYQAGEAAELLKAAGHNVPKTAEALTIWKTTWKKKPVWVISGFDDTGTMYGLLDFANQITLSSDGQIPLTEVKGITEKPDVTERAVSIFTMNRAYWESRFYDEAYWNAYLDMLAKNRFNSLVVIFGYENGGFLAPCYPYFFNVDGYNQVTMVGITKEQQQRNLQALNRLIKMTHDHGIRFTIGIWDHIYRGGVQGGGIPGTKDSPDKPTPGLVWGLNADNLTAYTKSALAKFVKEVPALDAIQFRMHDESGLKNGEQESFWLDVFRMIRKTAPDMRVDLRAKELKESIIQSAVDEKLNFRITTKYWMEQMGLPYHPTQINPEKSFRRHSYSDLLRFPKQYKMHWRLWNGGTSRILLWGNPDFVRRFAESSHLYDGNGYEVNEPLATKMEAQPHDAKPFDLLNEKYRYYRYEFERYWHFFQMFGRLGYNPNTASALWDKEFVKRFGKTAGPLVEKALHKASWILPRIISSSYPYSSFPMTRGWAEKQRLGDLPSFAKAEITDMMQFASFDEEARLILEGGATAKILPSANSLWFKQISRDLNLLINEAERSIGPDARSKEFISTITDLKILANLAAYHSSRIPAAVHYRLFERSQNVAALDEAIANERKAIDAWRQIVIAAGDVYADDLMMGVRNADLCGHWKDELAALEGGLAALEQKKQTLKTHAALKQVGITLKEARSIADADFKITHKRVTSASVGKPIKIEIQVSAPSGIKSVHLRYRSVNQEQQYQTLPMLLSGKKDVYEAVIPSEQVNPRWDMMYLIEVIDKKGNGKIYPDLNKETPYIIIKLNR